MKYLLSLLAFFAVSINGYVFMGGNRVQRATLTMKRGRGSFKKEIQGGKGMGTGSARTSGGMGGASTPATSANWVQIPGTAKEILNVPEGKVQVIDTNADGLIDGLVNPTGAVAVAKFEDATYCFGSTCPCCKIPLTKAKVISGESSPKLVCDFCKSAYDLKSGAKTEASEEESGTPGLLGGMVKNLFSASTNTDPIKIYALGEKNGKLLINL